MCGGVVIIFTRVKIINAVAPGVRGCGGNVSNTKVSTLRGGGDNSEYSE